MRAGDGAGNIVAGLTLGLNSKEKTNISVSHELYRGGGDGI